MAANHSSSSTYSLYSYSLNLNIYPNFTDTILRDVEGVGSVYNFLITFLIGIASVVSISSAFAKIDIVEYDPRDRDYLGEGLPCHEGKVAASNEYLMERATKSCERKISDQNISGPNGTVRFVTYSISQAGSGCSYLPRFSEIHCYNDVKDEVSFKLQKAVADSSICKGNLATSHEDPNVAQITKLANALIEENDSVQKKEFIESGVCASLIAVKYCKIFGRRPLFPLSCSESPVLLNPGGSALYDLNIEVMRELSSYIQRRKTLMSEGSKEIFDQNLISAPELYAIQFYTLENFFIINSAARGIATACLQKDVVEPYLKYVNHALAKLPRYEGRKVTRRVGGDFWKTFKPGHIYTQQGLGSFSSVVEESAMDSDFGTRAFLTVERPTLAPPIHSISTSKREMEYLFPAGTKFKVKEIRERPQNWGGVIPEFILEELEPDFSQLSETQHAELRAMKDTATLAQERARSEMLKTEEMEHQLAASEASLRLAVQKVEDAKKKRPASLNRSKSDLHNHERAKDDISGLIARMDLAVLAHLRAERNLKAHEGILKRIQSEVKEKLSAAQSLVGHAQGEEDSVTRYKDVLAKLKQWSKEDKKKMRR